MIDDGRLAALEQRYASTADRVAALEARWQDLADQYVAWRDEHPGEQELSIVEDREFPNAYAVLREQYEVDLELFELLQSMHELEDEIVVLRSQPPIPPDDLQVIPGPSPARGRPKRVRVLRITAIVLGVIALLFATYALTRGSGEQPTVEIAPAARQLAPISWRVSEPKIVKRTGACRKTARVTVGTGAEFAGKPVEVRVEGKDFPVADDRTYKLGRTGGVNVAYETKTCAGSPVDTVHVLTVDNDTNVATKSG